MGKNDEISTTLTTNDIHLHTFSIALVDGFATFNDIILYNIPTLTNAKYQGKNNDNYNFKQNLRM